MEPTLTIGTATDRIDLLDVHGFYVTDWRPSAEGTRDTFTDSALADYRQLRTYKRTTTTETITLALKTQTQNQTIRLTQRLRAMLDHARNYWATDWQDEVVYLKARASCEGNARYAVIHAGDFPQDDNPYGQWMVQRAPRALMERLNLSLERGPWLDNVPGTGTGIDIGADATYDGRTLGNVDSAGVADPTDDEGEVFIVNHHKVANLTDIYHFDATGPAWSANLMDAALPFVFLPVAPAVGDIAYFGIDTTVADSGPFCNLVFDIDVAIANVTGITWEYWNGAWVALTVQDNTNQDGAGGGVAFDTTGVRSVHWVQPADWTTVAVNGITGYWVRARVTAIGILPGPPRQQNRDIYTVSWPYVELQNDQIGGDLAAAIRVLVRNQSGGDGITTPKLDVVRLLAASRLVDRGANFTPFINLADEQNDAGITVATAGVGAFATFTGSPTGRVITITNPAASAQAGVVTIDNTTASEYKGQFRLFIRGDQTSGAAGDNSLQVIMYYIAGRPVYTSPVVEFERLSSYQLLDFGTVSIGTDTAPSVDLDQIQFQIFAAGDGAADMRLYDLILMPVDEWVIDTTDFDPWGNLIGERDGDNTYLNIDNITNPKLWVSHIREVASDLYYGPWIPIANGDPCLVPGEQSRVWFLAERNTAAVGFTPTWDIAISNTVTIQIAQRYHSMRGDQ